MTKLFIDLVLIIISAWTLGYHLTMFSRLPYYWAIIFAVIFLSILLFVYIKFRGGLPKYKKPKKSEIPILITVVVLALLLGLFSAATTGTDADTIGYFSNAIVQAYNLRSPIFTTFKMVAIEPPLPMLSWPNGFISLEPLYALVGRLTQIGPGVVYQTIVPFFFGIFTIICFYYVFSRMGLKRWEIVLALLSVLLFLYLSGNGKQYGNWMLSRNYRGKAFLPATFIPLFLLSLYQYLKHPNKKDLFLLSLYGITFIGATTTGPVFAVMVVLASSAAFLVAHGFSRNNLIKVTKLIPTTIYPVFFLAAYYFDIPPVEVSVGLSRPHNWYTEITSRVLTNDTITIAFGLILFAIPLLLFKKKEGIFYTFYSLFIVIAFANSIFGQMVIDYAGRPNQWRMYFLLPAPLLVGFLPLLIKKGLNNFRTHAQPTILIFGLLTFFTISLGSDSHIDVAWKENIFDYKVTPQFQHFLDEYDTSKFSYSVVLPTDEISIAFTLDDPTVKYYSNRIFYSKIMSRSNNLPELMTRSELQAGLASCDFSAIKENYEAIKYFIAADVDYIIYEDCNENFTNKLLDLLAQNGSYWKVDQYISPHPEDDDFVVWVLENN